MALRTAVITPYFKEDRSIITRCISSVQLQTTSADHILVSDGFPQDWIDKENVRHIKLDRSHGDYGNTPRGLGGLLAASESYDAICFLDADNWFNIDHVESCYSAAARAKGDISGCDMVIAKRVLRRIDESAMPLKEEAGHVDTNCFFFLCGSYHLLARWILMAQELSCIGDRIFYKSLNLSSLELAYVDHPTVNYLNTWASSYRALGETPPPEAKENVDMHGVHNWINSRTERQREIDQRMIGIRIASKASA